MASCPNKSLPEWKELVSIMGSETRALWAYTYNNNDIPDADLASEFKEMLDAKEGAVKVSEKVKTLRLTRVDEQLAVIEDVMKKAPKDGRQDVLKKLKANLEMYRKHIEDDMPTVSVTDLMAGGEIEGMDQKYQNYASFGIFVHHILEVLQKEIAGTDRSLTSIYSPERMDQIFKEYKDKFDIKGLIENGSILNTQELYNMTLEVLGVLNHYSSMGYTILPEMTIAGLDRNNRMIVGRLDMLAIDKNGKAVVIDLKTKKLKSTATKDSLNASYQVNAGTKTDQLFATGSRSTYENWDIQLGIYSRLLQQMDISTTEKRIIGLLYYGTYNTESGKQFTESGEDTFSYKFYKVKSYLSTEQDKGSENEYIRYKYLMRKVNRVIPVEDVTDEQATTQERVRNIFELSNEDAQKLVDELEKTVEAELKDTILKLKEAREKADKETVKFYEERRETLRIMQDNLRKDTWEAPYKVGIVIQALQIDSQNLVNQAASINSRISLEDLSTSAKYIAEQGKELEKLNNTAAGFNLVINQLNRLLIESGVNNNSLAVTTLNDIQNNIQRVKAYYNQLGFRHIVQVLSTSLSDTQLNRMNDQKRMIVEAELKRLKNRRDALLKNNVNSSIWYRMTNPVKNILRSATSQDVQPEDELEALELQIEKLELEMQGISLDVSDIKKFIAGISDPDSPIYIGQGTTFFTDKIASSSSSDWLLSSYTTQLKVALQSGRQEYINFVEREGLEKELGEYRRGERNVIALNAPISEVRYELQWDEEGNEQKVQRRSFVTPWAQEYYDIFDRYENTLYDLNKKISDEVDPEKKKQLQAQKSQVVKTHLEWRLANTEMRYKSDYYKIDQFLPEEYKQKRDELYKAKNSLENSVGFNNAELLDDYTVERIAQIEVELQKLKKEFSEKADGGYKQYLELQEEFFEYETNWNYFNRLYNQKKVELTDLNGKLNVEALEKWKQQNMIRRPKEQWYDTIADVWDQINEILGGQDPNIKELLDQYKEILKVYRRRGAVDSRFMSQEDIDTLNKIDSVINMYKAMPSGLELSFEEREELKDLFGYLESLQNKVENPFYVTEFNKRVEELEQSWSRYQNEQDETQKEFLMEQFITKEMDFKTWYDNNHTNKYVSKFISNQGLNPLPKKYNMLTIPSDESMMEEVPDYKFSRRVIKPTAINLEYQEDHMGYPVPKGVSIENARVSGDTQWINPKYQQIRNDSRLDKFYHSFVGRFLAMQEETVGKLLGYNFPGYEENSLQDIQDKGVMGGVKNQAKIFKDKNLTVGSDYDFSINGYGTKQEGRIQFKHNTPLPLEQQTRDGIAAVIKWFEEAHVNKAMAGSQVASATMISYMEEYYTQLGDQKFPGVEKRLIGLRKVIDQMKFEYNKFIKGEWKKDQGLAGRFGDLALRGISFTRLGFDLPNQIGNMFSGNVQAFLGSHKSGLYSSSNYLWAKNMIYNPYNGLINGFVKDFSKIGNKSFSTKMFLYWNPLGDSVDRYYDKTRTTGQRVAQGIADLDIAYMIQDKGEIEIGSTIWLSIMDNIRVNVVKSRDENGKVLEYEKDDNGNIKTINVYEAYMENEKGEIIIKPNVEWSKKDEAAVQRMVWSEQRRTQGRYADFDKTLFESGLIGRLVFYYRKYLEPSIRNRFGREEANWEAGEQAMGIYTGLTRAIRNYTLREFISGLFGGKGMNEYYQRKSQQSVREMAVAASMYIVGRLLVGAMPDDDEDDMSFGKFVTYNALAVYAKVDMETRSLVPIPIVGGLQNYLENLSSFTNAGRDISRTIDLVNHSLFLALVPFVNNSSDFGKYVNKEVYYQRKTKLFDKGDAKIKKDLYNLTGYMNMYELFNPEERIKNYKSRIN
jgi:hypothetical protein